MFLESSDVVQVMSCGTGEEYSLHVIQVYIVSGFVHHYDFFLNNDSNST